MYPQIFIENRKNISTVELADRAITCELLMVPLVHDFAQVKLFEHFILCAQYHVWNTFQIIKMKITINSSGLYYPETLLSLGNNEQLCFWKTKLRNLHFWVLLYPEMTVQDLWFYDKRTFGAHFLWFWQNACHNKFDGYN